SIRLSIDRTPVAAQPRPRLGAPANNKGNIVVRRIWLSTVGLTAIALSAPVLAQAPANQSATASTQRSRTTVYDAAYFAQFAPRTAYHIAQHVPGFQLDLGSTQSATGSVDVRGFAGTAGNVVLNGSRPPTKAETLDTTLQRIPAQRVIRVELGPGDIYGSDYAGKSQVLNIVMSDAGGFDANITASATRRYQGFIQPNVSGTAVLKRGPSTFNLSAGTGFNKQFEEGTDTLIDTATGDLVEFRRKHNQYANKNPFIAGSYILDNSTNKTIRINARWQPNRFDLLQTNRVTPSNAPAHDDNLIQDYSDPLIELGGDVTRPLAGGAIKFVGLATRRKRDDVDTYIQRDGLLHDDGQVNGGFEQTIKAKRNETLGRLSWTRSNLAGFSFEAGAEGSFNTLDDHVDLDLIDENGAHVPIDLSIANATVREKRGEVYVSVG